MPLEAPLLSISERVDQLNTDRHHHSATDVLAGALANPLVGRTALVSSFGAESVVLLHMVAQIDRTTPVLFIDTEMLFDETLSYQRDISDRLGLSNVQIIRADRDQVFLRDNDAMLHRKDPDACCALRKSEPLQRALAPYDAWITGRKRFQGGKRAAMDFFEAEREILIKINPLAKWKPSDIRDYMTNNRLPRHPLVARGYASIGCAPCTSSIEPGEDARAGRWRGRDKTECGIHFANGQVLRTPTLQGIFE